MAELCANAYTTGLRMELQQDIATVSQGSDVVSCGQLDEAASESTGSNVLDDFPSQPPFENATQDVSGVFPSHSIFPSHPVFPSHSVFPSQPVSGNTTQNVSDMFPSQPVSGNVMQQAYDLDFNHLLGLGKDVTSPNPSVQMTAVHNAMSIINSVTSPPATHGDSHSTASRGFSDMPFHRPPSSQTTPFSSMSKVVMSKQRPRTPARVVDIRPPSSASSVPDNEPSQTTHTNTVMASAVAMTGMTGAIDRATDCMKGFHGLLVPPVSNLPAALAGLPSQASSLRSQATANLNNDTSLDPNIRAQLALEFMINPAFCQLYAELNDPAVRERVAVTWYQAKEAGLSTSFSIPS